MISFANIWLQIKTDNLGNNLEQWNRAKKIINLRVLRVYGKQNDGVGPTLTEVIKCRLIISKELVDRQGGRNRVDAN